MLLCFKGFKHSSKGWKRSKSKGFHVFTRLAHFNFLVVMKTCFGRHRDPAYIKYFKSNSINFCQKWARSQCIFSFLCTMFRMVKFRFNTPFPNHASQTPLYLIMRCNFSLVANSSVAHYSLTIPCSSLQKLFVLKNYSLLFPRFACYLLQKLLIAQYHSLLVTKFALYLLQKLLVPKKHSLLLHCRYSEYLEISDFF